MDDDDISTYFRDARQLIREEGLHIFSKQIIVLREITSIIARITTLASLTTRNTWPILALTATIPLLDHLFGLIDWNKDPSRLGIYPV